MSGYGSKGGAASAAALALALAAGTADAAVTAQQVWDDWKAAFNLGGEGGATIGGESLAGNTLTVTDIAYSTTAEDGSVITWSLPELVLTEQGDGTVAITMSPEEPLSITTPGDPATGQEPVEVRMALRHSGLTITASGDPGAVAYDLAAARYALELLEVLEGGAVVPAEGLFAFNDVSGSFSTAQAELRTFDYDLQAASLDLLLDVTDSADGSRVSVSGQVQDVATQAEGSVPLDMATAPEAAMMNGLAFSGGYTYGAASYIFDLSDPSGSGNGTATLAGGELSFDLGREALSYATRATGLAVEATSAMMPFPVRASAAEYGVTVNFPTARTEAPAPWAFAVNLVDLDVNDEVWALFDPDATLPRDPATLRLDLDGTATLFYDVMDPAQQAQMDTAAVPGEVNSVTLNDLTLRVAGAEVLGTGAFTLDNADLTTFGGMPRPEGSAEFTLNGINGLIDKLVALGFIPADQVMGARMMLGLIAVPGEGPDQLTSRIEVTAEGQVLANGQRLR